MMNKDQHTEGTEQKVHASFGKAAPSADGTAAEYYTGIDWVSILFRLLEKIHWIILAALAGAVLALLYVTQIATPVYQATSKIYIAGSDTTISLSDLQMGSTLAVDYQEVFKIWHVHEMVDERLNLDYSYSELANMVSVSNPSGSHLLYIYVKSPDAKEAKELADTYAEVVQDYIANKMELRKPQILEKAKTPYKPIFPNVTSTVVKGALIGGLGIMIIFLFVFLLDDRIRTGDDIAKATDLPTFGTVPRQNMEKNSAEQETQEPAVEAGGHRAVYRGNLALDYAGEEAINAICSGITFAGKNMKRVLITSCGANEGKTFTALQIAIGMTRRGVRVLLIDADLRLSVMKMKYDIRFDGSCFGLAHLLSGQCTAEEAIYRTSIPNLDLLPDGASIKTPLSLLTSPEFDSLMLSAGEAYDLVIVDTPPLGAVVDAAEIARRCDGCLLVLEYNRTHGKGLKEAVSLLRQTGTPVLGCIVNKAAVTRLGQSRYSYYYGGKDGYRKAETGRKKGKHRRE